MSVTTIAPQQKQWWRCDNPRCRKTLGEIVGDKIVVRIGRGRVIIAAAHGATQTCSCGNHNVLSCYQDKRTA